MAKSPEYDAMSIDELKAIQSAVQTALDVKIEARRAELMQELALLGGAPAKAPRKPKETLPEGDARLAVKPKYRGPNGELWSARGATPRWLKTLEEAGHNREEFLIKD
jgi:DNA-binding protein H-NS